MEDFWRFINSSFFVSIITLAAGFIAYWLYRKKNKDFKKDAANIVLLEIQNAERTLVVAKERIQKDGMLEDNAYLMPTESWSKYKYMFVRDFDRDQWDIINAFYNKCSLFDNAVAQKSTTFQKNESEIRTNKISVFQDEYLALPADLTLYSPQKPTNDAKILLEGISNNLSQTAVGTNLKKLAGLKQDSQ